MSVWPWNGRGSTRGAVPQRTRVRTNFPRAASRRQKGERMPEEREEIRARWSCVTQEQQKTLNFVYQSSSTSTSRGRFRRAWPYIMRDSRPRTTTGRSRRARGNPSIRSPPFRPPHPNQREAEWPPHQRWSQQRAFSTPPAALSRHERCCNKPVESRPAVRRIASGAFTREKGAYLTCIARYAYT